MVMRFPDEECAIEQFAFAAARQHPRSTIRDES